MPIDELFKQLGNYLDKGERKKKARCERIDILLDKLKHKEKTLEKKLSKEKAPDKRKRLQIELKVVREQRKKGQKRRKELNTKRK